MFEGTNEDKPRLLSIYGCFVPLQKFNARHGSERKRNALVNPRAEFSEPGLACFGTGRWLRSNSNWKHIYILYIYSVWQLDPLGIMCRLLSDFCSSSLQPGHQEDLI